MTGRFRAIVVGGGPAGMAAAHMFSKAGIDFVILERRPSIWEDVGASLVLIPNALRVFGQIGILDKLYAMSIELGETFTVTEKGRIRRFSTAFSRLKKNHGYGGQIFNRAHLVQTLYDTLSEPAKSNVFTGKKAVSFTVNDAGVSVHCADGTRYDGSIIIGADGVHSAVRQSMHALAQQSKPSSPPLDGIDQEPFVCEYRVMWCSFPKQGEPHTPGRQWMTHAKDHSVQFLAGHERCWIFVYEKLQAPRKASQRYTQEDIAAFAENLGDLAVGEKLNVRDVFKQRYHAGMADLEEGVLEHWSRGRFVLVGDAAHRFTPNQGLGFNNGIQDVVALTNELYNIAQGSRGWLDGEMTGQNISSDEREEDSGPSTEALAAAFQRYQETRMEQTKKDLKISAFVTRFSAWKTGFHWFFDSWIMAFMQDFFESLMIDRFVGEGQRKGLVLDFLEGEELRTGAIPWVHPIPKRTSKA